MNQPQDRIAWIETIAPSEADGELKSLYEAHFDRQVGGVDHILQIHSLHPQSLQDHVQLYQTLMFAPSPLSRAEREMIAVVVSSINQCKY
ncbi:MAG: carboxymuconolactone decarboxylase family protein [Anaerolineaceae bacterium]|nr:carboxymuconolactone decarboxylase family protein [Anaerolineaceae bacterium]